MLFIHIWTILEQPFLSSSFSNIRDFDRIFRNFRALHTECYNPTPSKHPPKRHNRQRQILIKNSGRFPVHVTTVVVLLATAALVKPLIYNGVTEWKASSGTFSGMIDSIASACRVCTGRYSSSSRALLTPLLFPAAVAVRVFRRRGGGRRAVNRAV